MLKRTVISIFVISVLITSCVTVTPYSFSKQRSFESTIDEVWPVVMAYLAQQGSSIRTIEKDSGYISIGDYYLDYKNPG